MRRQKTPIRVAQQFESIEARPSLLQSISHSCRSSSDKQGILQLADTELTAPHAIARQLQNYFGPIKLHAPVASYQAVVVRIIRAADGACEPRLELQHEDPSLSIILPYAKHNDDCVAIWRILGRHLGLSLVFIDIDGAIFEVEKRMGNVVVKTPSTRLRGHGTRRRRPNFLRRRKHSQTRKEQVWHDEKELIAPDGT